MLSSILSLTILISAQAQKPSANIDVTCECAVYDSVSMTEVSVDGLNRNKQNSDILDPTMFGRVSGAQANVKAVEALICSDNSFGDIALSCPRAFSNALDNCRQEARALYPATDAGAESYSINPETCYASVQYAGE